KAANPIGEGPKRVPVSQHSAQSRLLELCPSNFAQRVPVQSKSVLSKQIASSNQTTQQPRPKFLGQSTTRPQVPSKNSEKTQQAPVPAKKSEAESTSKQKTEETAKKKNEETKK
ncbi:AURKA kinase, partial [Todus mexicanus]|nr:AURKA kinase [Todus mexicanus]